MNQLGKFPSSISASVGEQRKEMETIAEIPQCDRTTADGRTYPAQRKPVLTKFNPTTAEKDAIRVGLIALNSLIYRRMDFRHYRHFRHTGGFCYFCYFCSTVSRLNPPVM